MDKWEIYVLKYAERTNALKHEHFLFTDAHNGPMPMDYFIWALKNEEGRVIIVDMGFEQKEAKKRGRRLLRTPAEALAKVGIDASEVEDLVVSHMHYDHCGNAHEFPNATFHIQEREMAFATGPNMNHPAFRDIFSVDYVVDMVRALFGDRVKFVQGFKELAPGITLHHVGGHTDGLQVVRVNTQRGWVVLAVDAIHLYANIEEKNPFPLVLNVADMLNGYSTISNLADSPEHIIPGHDPLVLERFPKVPGAEEFAVRADLVPKHWN